jgi:methionine-rich copper-binding protein CopC
MLAGWNERTHSDAGKDEGMIVVNLVGTTRILLGIVAAMAFSIVASAADAHARLKRAIPAVGGVVNRSAVPAELQIWFSERIEAGLSTLQVVDHAGARVDGGDARIDPDDDTELRVTLRLPLQAGLYRVTWRVVSLDTHVTSGTFPFRVHGRTRPRLKP